MPLALADAEPHGPGNSYQHDVLRLVPEWETNFQLELLSTGRSRGALCRLRLWRPTRRASTRLALRPSTEKLGPNRQPQLSRRETLMTGKKQPAKKADKNKKEKRSPVQGSWPDPQSREEISHAEAEIDTGKHSKNPDWKKKW